MDARMDLRTEPSADPRMFGRGPEPRPDLRPDPRSDLRGDIRNEPREMRDLRDARDLRGEPLIDPRDPRFASSRDARDLREIRGSRDLYERDEMMDIDPPLSSGRLTTYFLPGDGISREVIQADICRYLGADATCMPYRNREVSLPVSKPIIIFKCSPESRVCQDI